LSAIPQLYLFRLLPALLPKAVGRNLERQDTLTCSQNKVPHGLGRCAPHGSMASASFRYNRPAAPKSGLDLASSADRAATPPTVSAVVAGEKRDHVSTSGRLPHEENSTLADRSSSAIFDCPSAQGEQSPLAFRLSTEVISGSIRLEEHFRLRFGCCRQSHIGPHGTARRQKRRVLPRTRMRSRLSIYLAK